MAFGYCNAVTIVLPIVVRVQRFQTKSLINVCLSLLSPVKLNDVHSNNYSCFNPYNQQMLHTQKAIQLVEKGDFMPKFELEVSLPVSSAQLSKDILCMSGVNYELFPLLRMTAPKNWYSMPFFDWPVNKEIFSSIILIAGLIPIDLHAFKLISVDSLGFKELSKSILNSVWSHERRISNTDSGAKVKDVISYQSKLGVLGFLLKPIYLSIFIYRHKRLKSKYV